ncbi:hypothetical protein ACP70R_027169 [Stipagrostis hirtigluma subsp. patula]
MRPSTPPAHLLAGMVLAAAVFALSLIGGARATVVTTCRAAADSDARVNYGFCVAELGNHRDNPDVDAWGLAKMAALTGASNADDAVYDISAMLSGSKPGGGGGGGAGVPTRAALGRCRELYGKMGLAFAEAHDEINRGDYAAGKARALEAAALAHQCDDAFAEAGAVRSPLAPRSSFAVQIAVIAAAITNLIK